ncbi:hypothetical protein AMATHDRAFT_151131 [Amanita thiersii Skay4041]|uniref:Cytochrome P450 n=1 Tax=Amanita thiersii Skay4041 TaxID=703135 RepID=A0A2A9NJJ8_9AGAR|nr:hypothetical protein AMATHDRAFT_151131 [Amanita thiersii Skay4041]
MALTVDHAVLVALIGLLACLPAVVLYRRHREHIGLPPGPPPHFLSGNSQQVPSEQPWKAYANWSHVYGDPIIHLRISNHSTIIVNSVRAAIDLLETRSNIYSDRPQSLSTWATQPFMWLYHWLFSSWTPRAIFGDRPSVFSTSLVHPRFKKYRKLLHAGLNPRMVKKYYDLMEHERRVMLKGLLEKPDEFFDHVRRNAGAIILKVAYGWEVNSTSDYFVRLMEEAFTIHNDINKPGGWLVEYFPLLRFLPSWVPGNAFKRKAAYYRDRMWDIDNAPHLWAKGQIESGNYIDSFTSQHLHPEDGHMVDAEEEDIIKWAGGALYFGGADTTVASVLSFILLMALHPEVQARAQEEIEWVVGRDRLPSLEDQGDLAYVAALIKEVLRFAPVAPLGLAHRVMEEDSYLGYRIPDGATVISNIWAITHDEEVYHDPYTFDPTRFLPPSSPNSEMDPRKFVFGFGRRVCPGVHFAETSLFLSITGILALYNISKKVDSDGKEITPSFDFTTGITSHPKPFSCCITPRSPEIVSPIV